MEQQQTPETTPAASNPPAWNNLERETFAQNVCVYSCVICGVEFVRSLSVSFGFPLNSSSTVLGYMVKCMREIYMTDVENS